MLEMHQCHRRAFTYGAPTRRIYTAPVLPRLMKSVRLSWDREGTAMSRLLLAAILVSVLAGCVTSEGPSSRLNVSSQNVQRAKHVNDQRANPARNTQIAVAK